MTLNKNGGIISVSHTCTFIKSLNHCACAGVNEQYLDQNYDLQLLAKCLISAVFVFQYRIFFNVKVILLHCYISSNYFIRDV